MEFEVLGTVRLRHRAGADVRLGPMQRTLLAVLIAAANRPLSADALADALWDDSPDGRADSNLRLHVHRLRKALGDADRLAFESGSYRLAVLPGELDADRFESLVDEATQIAGQDPERCVELVRKALELWQGAPYEGLDVPALSDEAQRLSDLRLWAIETMYEADLTRGRAAAVVSELSDLVRRYPLRERFAALLMTALYRAGRQAEALQVYQDARRNLVDELGLEPGSELRSVEQQVLAGGPVTLGSSDSVPIVPAQLPVNVGGFVGRENEAAKLDRLVDDSQDSARIATLSGSAGVGKTALAVWWAHRVRDRFPDGQLYVDLRGFGPDDPVSPGDALAGFLRALGVDGAAIPQDLGERAAKYRSLLAERQVLVVLDNARTADQVRPLLPGAESCVVLLTSRDALTGLGVREGAHRVDLDRLPVVESRRLLANLLGDRGADETDAIDELIGHCARLPLALRVAADLVRSRPARGVAGLVDELADERDRLDLLDVEEDSHSAVRAVLSWSYRQLSPAAARLFRRFGLHPGHGVDRYALAAMADIDVRSVRRSIDVLVRAHLVDEVASGRFRPHDLLRAYAKELAESVDSDDAIREAVGRLGDHYLSTASTAMDLLAPYEKDRRPTAPAAPGDVPKLTAYDDAWDWLDRERSNLLSLIPVGDAYTTLLSDLLWRYLEMGGYYDDALALHTQALTVARSSGDQLAEANTHRYLATIAHFLDEHEKSSTLDQRALALYRRAESVPGQAATLNNLGTTAFRRGDYREALAYFEQALPLYEEIGEHTLAIVLANAGSLHRELANYEAALAYLNQAEQYAAQYGDRSRQSMIMRDLSEVYANTGDTEAALGCALRALEIARAASARPAEADALNQLGAVHRVVGDYQLSLDYYDKALELAHATGAGVLVAEGLNGRGEAYRLRGEASLALRGHLEALELVVASGERYEEARSRACLGDAYSELGDRDRARDHWRHALEIYREIGVPRADEVRAKLEALDTTTP